MLNLPRSLSALLLVMMLSGAAVLSGGAATAQNPQQQWVGDLPIMANMTIEPELGFAFDSPGGRIVLVFASSSAASEDILAYYNDALSSLGWVGSDGTWERGEESLGLAQVDTSVGRLWRIRLSPR
ncbi:MAG: hypothetical protein VXZ67_07850 [Pseudomonadota bacterium]|nr:hypothetical protein [Pseudomonadota bacterium]